MDKYFIAVPYVFSVMGGTKATNDMKLIDEGLIGAVSEFRQEGRNADISCALRQNLLLAAVSPGRRNTLIFLERWSVYNEVSHTDVLYGQSEV